MRPSLSLQTEAPGPAAESAGDVVLIGNPNVGKSALFGALTGNYVSVSNYPGTTVEIATARIGGSGGARILLDTPGTHSLLPSSEDESVTRDVLLSGRAGAVIAVADAKNLERGVLLALQVAELEIPFVLCLNMADEARWRGIEVSEASLSRALGAPVVATVAVRREGIGRLEAALEDAAPGSVRVEYPPAVEKAILALAGDLPASPISARALALMVLSGDASLDRWLAGRLGGESLARVESIRARLAGSLDESPGLAIQSARRAKAARIASLAAPLVRVFPPRSPLARVLERATTHRLWGLPVLAAVLFLCYEFVGVFGAKTLVDLFEKTLFGRWISPFATALANRWIPWAFVRDLLVGPYGLITMALAYSLALLLPIVGTFFIAFGLLEDSGYLPRLAVMANRLFRKMGLNGKAVLPMALGLGCDTMATLTTRILETPKERLIVMLLLALGVPCSAQLTVVLAMLGGLSPWALVLWAGVVGGVLVVVGRLAAILLPGETGDFVLELPPLRIPRPGNILVKTVARIEWYLREAVPLFVAGTLLLFLADRLHLLGSLERVSAPVLKSLLGLPPETAEAFVVGFLRRDFGAAGLFEMARQGKLTPVQVLVAMTTITLFIPCIANFFMIVKERGWKTGLAIAGFVFPAALGVGAGLNALIHLFSISLR